jgi:hypothetical protein
VWLLRRYVCAGALSEFAAIHLYHRQEHIMPPPREERLQLLPHLQAPPACVDGMWPGDRMWPGDTDGMWPGDAGAGGGLRGTVFCHVNGREVRTDWAECSVGEVWPRCAWGDVTYSNPSEALKVLETADLLCRSARVSPKDILVLTPWTAQQRLIQAMLTGNTSSIEVYKTCEVDNDLLIQGQGGGGLAHLGAVGATSLRDIRVVLLQEAAVMSADVVLLSTVRSLPALANKGVASSRWVSEQLGALSDVRMLNVALSRARRALCIIGNAETLEASLVWRQLTQYYKDTGCFVSADVWPPR